MKKVKLQGLGRLKCDLQLNDIYLYTYKSKKVGEQQYRQDFYFSRIVETFLSIFHISKMLNFLTVTFFVPLNVLFKYVKKMGSKNSLQ